MLEKNYTSKYDIVRIVMIPKIIYEDESILVLDKPSGLVMHPFDHSKEDTLVEFLMEHIPESFSIDNSITLQDGRTISLGGIVHKLDRETSGVLVVAKTQKVFDELKDQFINHKTKKIYIAVVEGIIKEKSFTIDAPLGRNKKEYRQSTVASNPRGEFREAITEVEVLEIREETTLVKLFPKTGRTHQLRAHMSSIKHPIVGDKIYGSKMESERIMLHAENLSFVLEGEDFSFNSIVPVEFLVTNH